MTPQRWQPITPKVSGGTLLRNRAVAVQLIDQFDVENDERWLPTGGDTFCNVFVRDVTRAFGCELPGAFKEMIVNEIINWLHMNATDHGWRQVDRINVPSRAQLGYPVVAIWPNPTGTHGHIAIVRPETTDSANILIAQAGGQNFRLGPLANGFGTAKPEFWTHD